MSFNIPGYTLNDQVIYDSLHTRILSGERTEDKQPVVFKFLQDEYPSPADIERFKLEYEITKSFNSPAIDQAYGIEKLQNKYMIILEHVQGKTLADLIKKRKKLPLKDFFQIAIKIAEAIGEIHNHQVIHNDINPSNIIYHPDTQSLKIIDFGLSITLRTEWAPVINPNVIIGTLPYISPEQTGRMNRGIDYRTDFYSLGVSYYQLLTGQLPFAAQDPMELIHAHIAIVPKSPSEIDPEIPDALSAIVMKLLAKNAEERYLNAAGLVADLKHCLQQLDTTGRILPFTLGTKDLFNRFQIPEKLYGREKEREVILDTFERVMQGKTELMLVTGYSGIGKSALVHEIQRPIVNRWGYFVSGKFDQFRHNIPYAALTQAFKELVNQILTESEVKIASFREKILDAVKGNGQILIDIIPNLAMIIGEQPIVVEHGHTESQNLLSTVFQSLITVLAAPEHPLAIFLDDLQWADLASLKMVETLLGSNCGHLLIIGAYRNNEVSPAHPLMTTIESLRQNQVICQAIELAPLTLADVTALIADTLHQEAEKLTPLAEICYKKTEGNPFFLIQVLEAFYKEQLIHFDSKENCWKWNLELIQKKKITDNVVDLLIDKIRQLPLAAQRLLQLAACIGNVFDVKLLSDISGIGFEEMISPLQNILLEGFVLGFCEVNNVSAYQFVHDRIQQAAHSMLEEDERKLVHLTIARLLSHKISDKVSQDEVFDIANHYNMAIDPLIPDSVSVNERKKIAEIDLKAAQMAKSAAAFEPGLKYAEASIQCLTESDWTSNYSLIFESYLEAIENSFLSAKPDLMENYMAIALKHAKSIFDQIRIYKIKMEQLNNQYNHRASIDIAIGILAKLGVKIKPQPNKFDVLMAIIKTKVVLSGKKISDLFNLPLLTDPNKEAAISLLSNMGSSAYLSNRELLPIINYKAIQLSVRYGNSKYSPFFYCGHGLICCGYLDELENGYQFGKLGFKLMEKLNPERLEVKVTFLNNVMVNHWYEPVKQTLSKLLENYERGLNKGDLEYSFYSIQIWCHNSFHSGRPLKDLLKAIESYRLFIKKKGGVSPYYTMSALCQGITNLMELKTEPNKLLGPIYDERNKQLEGLSQHEVVTILFAVNTLNLMLSVIFEDYSDLAKTLETLSLYSDQFASTFFVTAFYFHQSLALLANYSSSSSKEKRTIRKIIKSNQKRTKKWIDFSPVNHAQKYYLVEAEWTNKVLEQPEKAIPLYLKAIEWAHKNDYIQEEALADELLAQLYLSQGNEKIAKVYLQDSRYSYLLWGANAKVEQLDKKYGRFLEQRSLSAEMATSTSTTASSSQSISASLDIRTIQKSSQTISSTIVLNDLLKNLMDLVMENAGAERSFFILGKDKKYLIEAEGSVEEKEMKVLQSIEITDAILPTSVINFVINTQESVVLDNAVNSDRFAKDPYIVKNKPKSVLCIPLLNQGALTGVLYLENNLTTGAFTKDRIDLLNLISAQIAISIDNARLYANTVELNTHLATLNTSLAALNASYERFVPKDFLSLLQKNTITEVILGDHVERNMSVLFTDIRNFTTRSEKMTPEQNFNFINGFLNLIAPIITKHHGFIDKYIGDAIMALYPENADDAVQCALEMQKILNEYNNQQIGQEPILIGIGINTGLLMLGTVGEEKRLGATVISDSVNIASRVESLTKVYNEKILITEETYQQLKDPLKYIIEKVDDTLVKGKSQKVTIYKVSSSAPVLKN